jgi:hypothetical protein
MSCRTAHRPNQRCSAQVVDAQVVDRLDVLPGEHRHPEAPMPGTRPVSIAAITMTGPRRPRPPERNPMHLIYDEHTFGLSEVGAGVLMVFGFMLAIIAIGFAHVGVLGLLDGRRSWRGAVAALVFFGGLGYFMFNTSLLHFDRIEMLDDGTWRIRNPVGMYLGELRPDTPVVITGHIVTIPDRYHRETGCEVVVDGGGQVFRSTYGPLDDAARACADRVARLRQAAADRQRRAPGAPVHGGPRWPRYVDLTAAVAVAIAFCVWLCVHVAYRRYMTKLRRDENWVVLTLTEPARLLLNVRVSGDGSKLVDAMPFAKKRWQPERVPVTADAPGPDGARRATDMTFDVTAADYPLPIGAEDTRVTELAAAGFERVTDADATFALPMAAGRRLELLGRISNGHVVSHHDASLTLTDPALAPRREWMRGVDSGIRQARIKAYLVLWLTVSVAVVAAVVVTFF